MKNYWLGKRRYEEGLKLKDDVPNHGFAPSFQERQVFVVVVGAEQMAVYENGELAGVKTFSESVPPEQIQELYSYEFVVLDTFDIEGFTITYALGG